MSTTGSSRAQQRLLDDQIEPFLQHLRGAGYAQRTLRKKRSARQCQRRLPEPGPQARQDYGLGVPDGESDPSREINTLKQILRQSYGLRTCKDML